jgi:CheR methyltransferase, all-alpha domain
LINPPFVDDIPIGDLHAAAVRCGTWPIAGRNHNARELLLTDADFQYLVRLAYDHTGIVLADSERNLVCSRLSRRVRSIRLRSTARPNANLNLSIDRMTARPDAAPSVVICG